MSKESKHPSRRDFGKTALALLLGSQAAGAASNPYHDKARGEQRKLAKSLKYSRDVEDLKKLTQDAYFDKDFPLKHMIIDVDAVKFPTASEEQMHLDSLYPDLKKFFDGDDDIATRHHGVLWRIMEAFQNGQQLSTSVYFMADPKQYHKVTLLSPLKSRKINQDINYGFGFSPQDAIDCGYKDDIKAPVYQAFLDYSAVGQTINNQYDLDSKRDGDNAEILLSRNRFADAFATLVLAQRYNTTYPARVMGAIRSVRVLQAGLHTQHFSDLGEKIPSGFLQFTAPAINNAASLADELLKKNELKLLTPREISLIADKIAKDVHLSSADIEKMGAKIVRARKAMMSPIKERIEKILNDPSYFKHDNALDVEIMNA